MSDPTVFIDEAGHRLVVFDLKDGKYEPFNISGVSEMHVDGVYEGIEIPDEEIRDE